MNQLILTNIDIEEIYPLFKINLLYCIDYHQIKDLKLCDGSYILNLGDQHWTCLYVKDKKGVYFDLFGVIYPTEVKKFCSNIIYNEDQIQSLKSVFCGYYCLYFLYYVTNHFKYNLQYTLNMFRSLFNDDENENEEEEKSRKEK